MITLSSFRSNILTISFQFFHNTLLYQKRFLSHLKFNALQTLLQTKKLKCCLETTEIHVSLCWKPKNDNLIEKNSKNYIKHFLWKIEKPKIIIYNLETP